MIKATIIDYKVGNIFSINQALIQTGFQTKITADLEEIKNTDAIILPGVGNFGAASRNLKPLASYIKKAVERGTPLLGSCLGMQLLFERSEEGEGNGLSLLNGGVVRFSNNMKTPHMGWNTIKTVKNCEVLKGLDGEYMYFVHSYYAKPEDREDIAAVTDYGIEFTSMVIRENIYGTQFHPEKSGAAGFRLLENFADMLKR